nr:immunoglobulin heavy chain junction region [Macaca mulatta]MOW75290.1 immunoglobulin heavy chain junction region [Macaca mulatta]MOW75321.1 immunoglobulin heavy chain junction region [Macaca mulatta]MOW75435.1 immunoglobulin heavy chain junction region [Macaca mulatta]MOW75444.1 immunoglobulin heavy chain junction region [Macaca mulatta]
CAKARGVLLPYFESW